MLLLANDFFNYSWNLKTRILFRLIDWTVHGYGYGYGYDSPYFAIPAQHYSVGSQKNSL